MQKSNVLETPEYPNLPKCENDSVGSISRDVANLNWLAGVIDGEGCLAVNWAVSYTVKRDNTIRKQFALRCSVRNTDPLMIQKISQIYHRHNLRFHWRWADQKWTEHPIWRDSLEIIVYCGGSLEKLLRLITPFLVTKKSQAEMILSYYDWRKSGVVPKRHPSPEQSKILAAKQLELESSLKKAKRTRYGFQRLPRLASMPIDLSNLEVMV